MNQQQRTGWAGVLGAALFVVVFTLEGWLRPGYDPRSQFVSELSLGPRGWIQIVNFVVSGFLLLVFARGLTAVFREGRASKAGPILLTIISVSLLVSGPFVMDPASTPRDLMTWHSRLHWGFGALVFALSPVSCFVFLRRFWIDPVWQSFRWWTLLIAIVVTTAVVFMSLATRPPAAPNAFNAWNGLFQRGLLIPYMLWICSFGYRLVRLAASAPSPEQARAINSALR